MRVVTLSSERFRELMIAIRGDGGAAASGNLGGWRPVGRCGGVPPARPDVAPEWARVRRARVGHDDPHGVGRRDGGGERGVRSVRAQHRQGRVASGSNALKPCCCHAPSLVIPQRSSRSWHFD